MQTQVTQGPVFKEEGCAVHLSDGRQCPAEDLSPGIKGINYCLLCL